VFLHHRSTSLFAWAPAKLNVFLEVCNKRPDGYHELDTLMVPVNLYDTLCFSESTPGETRLHCQSEWANNVVRDTEPTLSEGSDNLIIKVIDLLRVKTGTDRGVNIHLRKRIPISSGLGGGSSNAATTLVALNRLWDLNLSFEQLNAFASELGSDINFFLHESSAQCSGRGEIVTPFHFPMALYCVVICPNFGLSTREVFSHCSPPTIPNTSDHLIEVLKQRSLFAIGKNLFNRLWYAASYVCQDICKLQECFDRLDFIGHGLSGSGSAYYGISRSFREAQRHTARLTSEGYRAFCVRTIS